MSEGQGRRGRDSPSERKATQPRFLSPTPLRVDLDMGRLSRTARAKGLCSWWQSVSPQSPPGWTPRAEQMGRGTEGLTEGADPGPG